MYKSFLKFTLLFMRYKSINAVHQFLFYLRKLPLIGKRIPTSVHRLSEMHSLVTLFGLLIGFSKQLFNKLLYFGVYFVAPVIALQDANSNNQNILHTITWLFIGLNLIAVGPIKSATQADGELIDYELLLIFRVPAKRYYILKILSGILIPTFFFSLIGLVAFHIFQLPLLALVSLLFSYICMRVVHEAIGALMFKYGKAATGSWKQVVIRKLPFMLSGPLVIILGFFLNFNFGRFNQSIYFILPIVTFVLAIMSFIVLKNYDFNLLKRKQLDVHRFLENKAALSGGLNLQTNIVKKEQYEDQVPEEKLRGKTGLSYAHALFFNRFRKVLQRPMLIQFIIIFLLGALLILLSLVTGFRIPRGSLRITDLYPALFIVTYFYTSLGDRYTKLLFANMDINLLPYSFYRRKEIVLEGLRIRSLYLALLNLPTLITVSAWIVILGFLHIPDQKFGILFFLLAFWLQTMFFNIYYLILYYAFQPYDENMKVKSLPIQISNAVIYLLTFSLFYIDHVPLEIYYIIMGLQLLFLIVSLFLVGKLAPKNFRLKQ